MKTVIQRFCTSSLTLIVILFYASFTFAADALQNVSCQGKFTGPASAARLNDQAGSIDQEAENLDTALLSATRNGWYAATAVSFVTFSDKRLKENIQIIPNALEKLKQIDGVTFQWKTDKRADMGVIAQKVEKVFPELVYSDEKGRKSVNYSGLIAPLIEVVKKQQSQIDAQQEIIRKLDERLKHLESR